MRRHQRKRLGCRGSQLDWRSLWEQRAKAGGPVKGEWTSLVTHLISCHILRALFSLKCFKMTCPLSHFHMLIVEKYKKEEDVGRGAHRIPPSNTTIDILAHFLLVLFSIHFVFLSVAESTPYVSVCILHSLLNKISQAFPDVLSGCLFYCHRNPISWAGQCWSGKSNRIREQKELPA